MKMRTLSKILALLTLMLSLFVGYSTFVVDHVETLTPTEAVTPVCYIKSTGKKYTRIEKAVQVANDSDSNETVVVMDGVNPVIENSFTINSNVTLLISYSGETRSTKAASESHTETDLSGQILTKSVILTNNSTITNEGTIEIGGILSGGNGGVAFAGHTGADYAQILMTPGTKITNKGSIFCFGYIRDGGYNKETKEITYKHYETGGGSIENTGGNFYIPFILRDYRGGTTMVSIGNSIDTYHVSAFNQIDFRNVTCSISFDYNSHLTGYANLYTGKAAGGIIQAQMNSTDITLIGLPKTIDSNTIVYLIEPTSTSFKLVAHTNINDEVTKIDIYGGARTNSMTLDVHVGSVIDASVSTEKVYFPLSFRTQIALHKAENQSTASFAMDQKYKIMAGSSVTIDEGVTLNATEIIVYGKDDFIDGSSSEHNVGGTKYPRSNPVTEMALEEGKLIVNGTLNVTKFGGFVYTETSDAVLNITSSATSSSNEAKKQDTSSLSPTNYKLAEVYTINKGVSLYSLDYYKGNTFSIKDNIPVGSYSSLKVGDSYGFFTGHTNFRINYINVSSNPNFDNNKVTNTNISEFNKYTSTSLLKSSYEGGLFKTNGYYLDSSLTNQITSIEGSSLVQSLINENNDTLNVYVSWIDNSTYTIQYSFYKSSGIQTSVVIDNVELNNLSSYSASSSSLSGFSNTFETYVEKNGKKFSKTIHTFSKWTLENGTQINDGSSINESMDANGDKLIEISAYYSENTGYYVENIDKNSIINSVTLNGSALSDTNCYIFSGQSITVTVSGYLNPFGTGKTVYIYYNNGKSSASVTQKYLSTNSISKSYEDLLLNTTPSIITIA